MKYPKKKQFYNNDDSSQQIHIQHRKYTTYNQSFYRSHNFHRKFYEKARHHNMDNANSQRETQSRVKNIDRAQVGNWNHFFNEAEFASFEGQHCPEKEKGPVSKQFFHSDPFKLNKGKQPETAHHTGLRYNQNYSGVPPKFVNNNNGFGLRNSKNIGFGHKRDQASNSSELGHKIETENKNKFGHKKENNGVFCHKNGKTNSRMGHNEKLKNQDIKKKETNNRFDHQRKIQRISPKSQNFKQNNSGKFENSKEKSCFGKINPKPETLDNLSMLNSSSILNNDKSENDNKENTSNNDSIENNAKNSNNLECSLSYVIDPESSQAKGEVSSQYQCKYNLLYPEMEDASTKKKTHLKVIPKTTSPLTIKEKGIDKIDREGGLFSDPLKKNTKDHKCDSLLGDTHFPFFQNTSQDSVSSVSSESSYFETKEEIAINEQLQKQISNEQLPSEKKQGEISNCTSSFGTLEIASSLIENNFERTCETLNGQMENLNNQPCFTIHAEVTTNIVEKQPEISNLLESEANQVETEKDYQSKMPILNQQPEIISNEFKETSHQLETQNQLEITFNHPETTSESTKTDNQLKSSNHLKISCPQLEIVSNQQNELNETIQIEQSQPEITNDKLKNSNQKEDQHQLKDNSFQQEIVFLKEIPNQPANQLKGSSNETKKQKISNQSETSNKISNQLETVNNLETTSNQPETSSDAMKETPNCSEIESNQIVKETSKQWKIDQTEETDNINTEKSSHSQESSNDSERISQPSCSQLEDISSFPCGQTSVNDSPEKQKSLTEILNDMISQVSTISSIKTNTNKTPYKPSFLSEKCEQFETSQNIDDAIENEIWVKTEKEQDLLHEDTFSLTLGQREIHSTESPLKDDKLNSFCCNKNILNELDSINFNNLPVHDLFGSQSDFFLQPNKSLFVDESSSQNKYFPSIHKTKDISQKNSRENDIYYNKDVIPNSQEPFNSSDLKNCPTLKKLSKTTNAKTVGRLSKELPIDGSLSGEESNAFDSEENDLNAEFHNCFTKLSSIPNNENLSNNTPTTSYVARNMPITSTEYNNKTKKHLFSKLSPVAYRDTTVLSSQFLPNIKNHPFPYSSTQYSQKHKTLPLPQVSVLNFSQNEEDTMERNSKDFRLLTNTEKNFDVSDDSSCTSADLNLKKCTQPFNISMPKQKLIDSQVIEKEEIGSLAPVIRDFINNLETDSPILNSVSNQDPSDDLICKNSLLKQHSKKITKKSCINSKLIRNQDNLNKKEFEKNLKLCLAKVKEFILNKRKYYIKNKVNAANVKVKLEEVNNKKIKSSTDFIFSLVKPSTNNLKSIPSHNVSVNIQTILETQKKKAPNNLLSVNLEEPSEFTPYEFKTSYHSMANYNWWEPYLNDDNLAIASNVEEKVPQTGDTVLCDEPKTNCDSKSHDDVIEITDNSTDCVETLEQQSHKKTKSKLKLSGQVHKRLKTKSCGKENSEKDETKKKDTLKKKRKIKDDFNDVNNEFSKNNFDIKQIKIKKTKLTKNQDHVQDKTDKSLDQNRDDNNEVNPISNENITQNKDPNADEDKTEVSSLLNQKVNNELKTTKKVKSLNEEEIELQEKKLLSNDFKKEECDPPIKNDAATFSQFLGDASLSLTSKNSVLEVLEEMEEITSNLKVLSAACRIFETPAMLAQIFNNAKILKKKYKFFYNDIIARINDTNDTYQCPTVIELNYLKAMLKTLVYSCKSLEAKTNLWEVIMMIKQIKQHLRCLKLNVQMKKPSDINPEEKAKERSSSFGLVTSVATRATQEVDPKIDSNSKGKKKKLSWSSLENVSSSITLDSNPIRTDKDKRCKKKSSGKATQKAPKGLDKTARTIPSAKKPTLKKTLSKTTTTLKLKKKNKKKKKTNKTSLKTKM